MLPLDVLREHAALDTIDLVFLLVALDDSNRFIVIDSLAGCGKTTMLMDLVCRINQPEAVLLLSFTRAAVRVASLRMLHRKSTLKSQTFDSLFFHAVRHSLGSFYDGLDYQEYRDLSQTLSSEHLEDFECKARVRYRLKDVRYILVDEAQDTPPEAFSILQSFRDMGKTVIVTGDRNQAIFRSFMGTENLFDQISKSDALFHSLHTTKRCGVHVVEYIRRRFQLPMVSATGSAVPSVQTVCVQARSNKTLARLYGTLLFSMNCPVEVHVAKESEEKFHDALYQDVAKRYGDGVERAKELVDHRLGVLKQIGRHSKVLMVFSTVHHFKGGEADITILGDDIEPNVNNGNVDDEMVKYVACTRARWGIVDTKAWTFHGDPAVRPLVSAMFMERHAHSFINSVSAASHTPLCIVPLMVDPELVPVVDALRSCLRDLGRVETTPLPDSDAMCVGSYCDILLGWKLESMALAHQKRVMTGDIHGYRVTVEHDRRYRSQYRRGLVPHDVHETMSRKLADLRLASLFGRYLVVTGAMPWTSPIVYQGCKAHARLHSFLLCKNLVVLQEPWPTRQCRARILRILSAIDKLPGIMGRPAEWEMLLVQQPIGPGTLRLRGIFDILIVDQADRRHLVEVKTVRQLLGGHVLQTLLYAAMLRLNTEVVIDDVCIYEMMRSEMITFPNHVVETLLGLLLHNPDLVSKLNKVVSAKHAPMYYSDAPVWA